MTQKDEPPRSEGFQYATEEEQKTTTNSSRKNEEAGSHQNNTQLWMCLVRKVKSNAVKKSTA